MTYTEMKRELDATWYEQPAAVRVLAARFYIGAENIETLRSLAVEGPCHNRAVRRPVLSTQAVDYIIAMR